MLAFAIIYVTQVSLIVLLRALRIFRIIWIVKNFNVLTLGTLLGKLQVRTWLSSYTGHHVVACQILCKAPRGEAQIRTSQFCCLITPSSPLSSLVAVLETSCILEASRVWFGPIPPQPALTFWTNSDCPCVCNVTCDALLCLLHLIRANSPATCWLDRDPAESLGFPEVSPDASQDTHMCVCLWRCRTSFTATGGSSQSWSCSSSSSSWDT